MKSWAGTSLSGDGHHQSAEKCSQVVTDYVSMDVGVIKKSVMVFFCMARYIIHC